MKIIVIPNQKYTYRDHKRFGVEYFIEQGINVEVFDIDNILYPDIDWEQMGDKRYIFEGYRQFENAKQFIDAFKELTKDDYIFLYPSNEILIELLKKIKTITDAKLITYYGGAIPITHYKCVNPIKTFVRFFRRMMKKTYHFQKFPLDIVFIGSEIDEEYASPYINKKTKLVKVHSRDYNLSLETEKEYKHTKKYCVFLDTEAINASDYKLLNINHEITKEQTIFYYQKLFNFFKWIEKEYNVDVIIAAHPKNRKYLNKKSINNFLIEHNQSALLVKNADFVLTEGSTAVSFALFFNKPIVLFTMNELSFFKHTCVFSKELKKEVIKVDDLIENIKIKMNKELKNFNGYEQYKYKYITFSDNKRHSMDIIKKTLEQELNARR